MKCLVARSLILSCLVGTWLLAEAPQLTTALREKFSLAPHYTQLAMVGDFPVVASAAVNPAALQEAAHTVRSMLAGRQDILAKLAENKIRLGIMATAERTCDLPEHADLAPAAYWNKRARGLGASKERPCVSCAEENVLNLPTDPYKTESILVHEFAHAIHLMALLDLDPTFDDRLEKAYQSAKAKGLWQHCYALENSREYWAEAVQSWFDTNRENDALHNQVNTRSELLDYDPSVAALCREVFKSNDWKYVRTDAPSRQAEPHLKSLDRSQLPVFRWTPEEITSYEAAPKPQ
jgi:hypothetical protein